ncbi:MAG: uroporphyrinogen-III synthase, partial [Rhodanobacter sp.]
MRRSSSRQASGLHGRCVVITRPVGSAAPLMRGVRAAGGLPVLLPGMALRGAPDSAAARKELLAALGDEFV